MTKMLTKRALLRAGALGFSAFAVRVSAAPAAEAVTSALIAGAKKEGRVSFYTAMDLEFAERLGKACLLYTSPSPRDRQKSRMPSSA